MKPTLGWTMLSRAEMRQVERSLANSDQDTRDEIGFLLIHQGFADRFFPGTSVLHTRVRYALFVPWLYQRAAFSRRRFTFRRPVRQGPALSLERACSGCHGPCAASGITVGRGQCAMIWRRHLRRCS